MEAGYHISRHFFLGLSISSANANTGVFGWEDTNKSVHLYNYAVSIVDLGLSGRYYLMTSERFKPFIGATAAYSFVNIISNGELPYNGAASLSEKTFSYQAYVGLEYYFIKWLGINIRAGYGTSYYGAIGLSFKISVKQDD